MLAVVVCAVVAFATDAYAQGQFVQRRLVRLFDFEEGVLGNFEPLPMHWYRIGARPDTADAQFMRLPYHAQLTSLAGFPGYTEVRFDIPQRVSGNHSLYLGLDGGNAGAFLEVGAVPAVPNSDYLITARVKTAKLRRASARFTACFVDGKGAIIQPSEVTSLPLTTDGRWQTVTLKLLGMHPAAAWIGLKAELLQPTRDPHSPLGTEQVVLNQVDGEAWFDDITIWQLPSVRIATQSPVNVIRAPHHPRVTCEVRDLTGRSLVTHLIVYDHVMRPVDALVRRIGAGEPAVWTWNPRLPGHGWYLADLTVHEPLDDAAERVSPPVARTLGAWLWLADESPMPPTEAVRFGISAEAASREELNLLPRMADAARVGSVTISAWDRESTLADIEQRQAFLDGLMHQIQGAGRNVIMGLAPLPKDFARSLDADQWDPLSLLSRAPETWLPLVKPVLLRHGQRVRNWQLGSPTSPEGFSMPDLASTIATIRHEFEKMAPQPDLRLPWSIHESRQQDMGDVQTVVLNVPPTVNASRIGDYLEEWRQPPAMNLILQFRQTPATEMQHGDRVTDLALRMIHAWEADAAGMAIPTPWTAVTEHETHLLPDPLLGVFSGIAHRLAGKRVIDRLAVTPGMQCMILASGGSADTGGTLIVWNESAPADRAKLDMYIGAAPVAVDVWGTRTAVPLVDGRHQWPVGATPVFIEGIDTQLALFRAAFSITPSFIESRQIPHRRTITLRNPWNRTISGHMTIVEPSRWKIEPSRSFFSIAAGQTEEIPVIVSFPVSEVAGAKTLVAQLDFMADRHYSVHFETNMELGLDHIEFDASLTVERNSTTGSVDAMVTQLITNKSDHPVSLYAFANMDGYTRQERTISQLKPGQSTVRRFRFADAKDALEAGQSIRVGLRETSGPALLNQLLRLDDHDAGSAGG